MSLIEPGKYRAKCISRQWGYTNDDKEQVLLDFEITEDGEYKGWVRPWFGYFTDKTWERTLESLKNCGWDGGSVLDLGPLDQEVEIVIDVEADLEGVDQNKIRWVNRIGAGRIQLKKPMGEDQLRMFAARLKSRQPVPRSASAPRSQRSNSGPPPSDWDSPPPDDSDIPF